MIQIKKSHTVAVPEESLGAALLDPAVLKQAIPGIKAVRKLSDTMFWGTANVGVLRFSIDLDANIEAKPTPHGFHLNGTVRAGSVDVGTVDMKLTFHEQDGATRVDSVTDLYPTRPHGKVVTAAGKATASKLLDSFFGRLKTAVKA